jgi:glycosyltransferase involved in cell wall biosynthesis
MNSTGFLGGAERSLIDLMRAIRAAHPQWTLELIAAGNGGLVEEARASGINSYVLPMPAATARVGDAGAGGPAGRQFSAFGAAGKLFLSMPRLAAYARELRALMVARKPDLVHSNGLKTDLLAVWASPPRSKLIWHIHDYVSCRPLMSRLLRLHARRCDTAIANSRSVARDVGSVCHGRLKVHTVYNAVDLEAFTPVGPKLDLDALSGLPPAPADTVRVGLVATMARWKGHEVFLHALAALKSRASIRGYIVGGPIYETHGSQYNLDELRGLARQLHVADRLGFTGFVKDSAAAMRALDVVVHASTQPEPFGLVVAEAMACGKPIVTSGVGGVAEIIAENSTALSHPPSDAIAMAGCIARLAGDFDLRTKLGDEGRRQAQARFDRLRLAHDLAPIYESLTAA